MDRIRAFRYPLPSLLPPIPSSLSSRNTNDEETPYPYLPSLPHSPLLLLPVRLPSSPPSPYSRARVTCTQSQPSTVVQYAAVPMCVNTYARAHTHTYTRIKSIINTSYNLWE